MVQMILVFANGVIPTALKPKHNLLGAHPTGLALLYTIAFHLGYVADLLSETVRSDLFERIKTGTVEPHRASISRFTETGIELTTGEKIEPLDAVVSCTGYRVSCS